MRSEKPNPKPETKGLKGIDPIREARVSALRSHIKRTLGRWALAASVSAAAAGAGGTLVENTVSDAFGVGSPEIKQQDKDILDKVKDIIKEESPYKEVAVNLADLAFWATFLLIFYETVARFNRLLKKYVIKPVKGSEMAVQKKLKAVIEKINKIIERYNELVREVEALRDSPENRLRRSAGLPEDVPPELMEKLIALVREYHAAESEIAPEDLRRL